MSGINSILVVHFGESVPEPIHRTLSQCYALETAFGLDRALNKLAGSTTFNGIVIVAEQPRLVNPDLLDRVRMLAPETPCIVLSPASDRDRHARFDHPAVFAIVDHEQNPHELRSKLHQAVNERHRRLGWRTLDPNIQSGVNLLVQLLWRTHPSAFPHVTRLATVAEQIAQVICPERSRVVRAAARLSYSGCIELPADIVRRVAVGDTLDEPTLSIFQNHPRNGAEILSHLPGFEEITRAIRYQLKNYDGTGVPFDPLAGRHIPLLARILRVSDEVVRLQTRGADPGLTTALLATTPECFDPDILRAVSTILAGGRTQRTAAGNRVPTGAMTWTQ